MPDTLNMVQVLKLMFLHLNIHRAPAHQASIQICLPVFRCLSNLLEPITIPYPSAISSRTIDLVHLNRSICRLIRRCISQQVAFGVDSTVSCLGYHLTTQACVRTSLSKYRRTCRVHSMRRGFAVHARHVFRSCVACARPLPLIEPDWEWSAEH